MSNPDPQPDQKPGIWQSILQAAEGLPRELRFIVVFGVLLSILFIAGPNIPNNLVPLLYILLIGGMGLYIYGEYQISQRQKEEHRHLEKIEEINKPASPPVSVLPETPPEPDKTDLKRHYLRQLFLACGVIPMALVDRRIQQSRSAQIALQAVFTALDVADTRRPEQDMAALGRAEKENREPALAAISRHRHLVLLGQPGSGKSTLVNFITYCLAGEGLGDENINSRRLNEMGWTLPGLLPLRVILRDYAARGLPQKQSLWNFLVSELQTAGLGAYQRELKEHLERRGGVLLLDGLDEVPEAHQRREQLRQAVLTFVSDFPQVRIVVTSRPYAYDADWHLPDFTRADLLDFNQEQIDHYIDSWYAVTGQIDPDLPPVRAAQYAEQLKREVRGKPNLAELAPRPLLLALMVSLHRWYHGGGLPEKREELYDQSVDLLLEVWQQPKQLYDAQGRPTGEQTSALVELGIGRDGLRLALSRVAFEAHRDQPKAQTGTADIPGGKLAQALYETPGRKSDIGIDSVIAYIEHRAGLLEERGKDRQGQGIYAFPHRTFQEYLAACHLFGQSTFPKELVKLARAEPQRWREAVLLAAGRAMSANSQALVWQLVQALCPQPLPPDPAAVGEPDWWGAFLAGRVLWDVGLFQVEDEEEHLQAVLHRVRAWLVALLAHSPLPPLDRAAAGEVADRLGYLSPDLNSWLPCPGCEKGGGDLLVMKYPVTNAQFELFMKAGGYQEQAYWLAGRFGEWAEPRYWDDARFGRKRRAFPVVGVSWYEACAYAAWLTALLARARQGESLPDAERALVADLLTAEAAQVRLPEDAEWVKIAGGQEKDRYPWDAVGGPATRDAGAILERANTRELGWGQTTPVYQYPGGQSVPYGVMDMAGNVWEWTNTETSGGGRALRGGSWVYNQYDARVAARNDNYPDGGYFFVGFRVVAPVLLAPGF